MIDKQTAILQEIAEGAYVIEVMPDSPADEAGLFEEDIIIEVDGKRIKGDDDQEITKILLNKRVGDRVRLKIWREQTIKEYMLTLQTYK
jgi:S1-C subfamily serine protease